MKSPRAFWGISFLPSYKHNNIASHKKRKSVICWCYSQLIGLLLEYFEWPFSVTMSEYQRNIKELSHFYFTVKAKTSQEVMNNRPVPGVIDASLAAEYKVIILKPVILDLFGSFK